MTSVTRPCPFCHFADPVNMGVHQRCQRCMGIYNSFTGKPYIEQDSPLLLEQYRVKPDHPAGGSHDPSPDP